MKSFSSKTQSCVLYISTSASRKLYKYIYVYVYIYKFEFMCVLLDFISVFNFDKTKAFVLLVKLLSTENKLPKQKCLHYFQTYNLNKEIKWIINMNYLFIIVGFPVSFYMCM